jgi:hypothetical protein
VFELLLEFEEEGLVPFDPELDEEEVAEPLEEAATELPAKELACESPTAPTALFAGALL